MIINKKREKRGITPLIATVLLIGFTIVLAMLVWFWFSEFITEKTQKQGEIVEAQLSCVTGIDFRIRRACFDPPPINSVTLTIENNANNKVDGFIVRIAGQNDPDVDVFDIPKSINALSVEDIQVFPDKVSSPTNAIVIPRLTIGGGTTSCSEQAAEVFLDVPC